MTKQITSHQMFTESDYKYLKSKGYSNKEILAIWNRDQSNGNNPVVHQIIPNIVKYFSN